MIKLFFLCIILFSPCLFTVEAWKVVQNLPEREKEPGFITEKLLLEDVKKRSVKAYLRYPNTEDYTENDMIIYVPPDRTINVWEINRAFVRKAMDSLKDHFDKQDGTGENSLRDHKKRKTLSLRGSRAA
jgi:hypothetical protein